MEREASAEEIARIVAHLTPVEREQMERMSDTSTFWSKTHDWPRIRLGLSAKGLIRHAAAKGSTWRDEVTVPTDLGRQVRAALALPLHKGSGEP